MKSRSLSSLAGNQQIRYLSVGVFNTLLGLLTYFLIQYIYGFYIGYLGSLLFAHFLVSFVAFILYRKFVFYKTGNVVLDFLKFQAVYSVSLGINLIVLPAVILATGVNPYMGQVFSITIITVISYFGHKYFSFRIHKKRSVPKN